MLLVNFLLILITLIIFFTQIRSILDYKESQTGVMIDRKRERRQKCIMGKNMLIMKAPKVKGYT